jgi:hypothetical protein
MQRTLKYLMALTACMVLISCASTHSRAKAPSATSGGSRTIILDGGRVSEDAVGGFTSWYCVDFIDEGEILVEVGFFNNPDFGLVGFILFEGGYSGEFTSYRRDGLNHRWDWGPNKNDYAFVIKPDGVGLYYDFTVVPKGEPTKARDVYRCKKR